jgi:nucleoside-diphosphate-sugar epimerase
VAVIGATGSIGPHVVDELVARSVPVRVVGRNEESLSRLRAGRPEVETVVADVTTADGAKSAVDGSEAVLYTLGLPYTKAAFSTYPQIMELMVDAASAAGARRLIQIAPVYAYGPPQTRPVTEDHPLEPSAVKGRHRLAQEQVTLGAHGASGLATLVLRLPDFFGPHTGGSGLLDMATDAAIAGKRGMVLGPVDVDHEWVYTPDVAPVVADLLDKPEVFGRAYNMAGSGVTTARQVVDEIYRAAGQQPRILVMPPWATRVVGLAVPVMRELAEVSYLLKTPVLLDETRLATALGHPVAHTSYAQAAADVVAARRTLAGSAR